MAIDSKNRIEVVLPDDTVIEANIEGALDAGDEVIGRVKITDGVEVANVNASNQVEVSVENTVVADVTGQGDVPITLDSEVVEVDATGQGDVPITLDSEVVEVDATGQGDIPVTLDSEAVVLGAGTTSVGGTKDDGPQWTSVYTYTTSADMTTPADLTVAPTGGQKLVITDIIISSDTQMLFVFLEETSATVIGAVRLAEDATIQITPRSKWKLPVADKKLQGDASIAGNVYLTIFYYSEA